MTNSNDPIVATVYRRIGDNEYRTATVKDINEGIFLVHKEGLTKREYFASNQQLTEELSISMAKIVMGEDNPQVWNLDAVKWWALAEMKYRLLKADALIEALNQK